MDTHENFKSDSIETVRSEVPQIMCHVCNINVPVIYLKEHYKSIKHTTCLDIANNAIDRMQKNTTRRNFEKDKLNVLNTTYFCESCVTIVANKDKKEHEKSKNHLQMIKRDNLLNEFSKIYIGRDKTSIDRICDVIAEKQNGDKQNNNADIKTQKHITDTINTQEKSVAERKEELIISSKNNTAEGIVDDLSDVDFSVRKKINAALYIRIATIIYNTLGKINKPTTHSLRALDKDYIEINVHNGTVKVFIDNFHGLKEMGKNKYVCLLCNVVGIDKDVHEDREHIFKIEHIKKVMASIKTIHCIRQIDNEWSHCLICNHLITNSGIRTNTHITHNLEHSFKLEHALVTSNEAVQRAEPTIDNEWSHCLICNHLITNSGIRTNIHITHNLEHSFKLEHALVTSNEAVQRAEPTVIQEQKKKSRAKTKKMNMRYCGICNIELNVNNMFSHLQGIRHEFNVKRREEDSVFRTGSLGENIEFIQQLGTDKLVEEEQIKTEVDTQNTHKVAYSQGDGHVTNLEKEEYEMETKTLSANNTEHDFIKESEKKENVIKKKLNDLIDEDIPSEADEDIPSEASNESISEETDTEWENEQDIEDYIFRNNFARIHEDTINCKLCNIELPIQRHIIKQHLKEQKHKSLYNSALILNMVNVVDDDFYCEICELHMKKGFAFEHITSLLHEKNKYDFINNENKVKLIGPISHDSDICNVCKLYVGAHNMDMHIKGKKHLAKLKDKGAEYYQCDICKVKIIVQLAQIKAHYNGEKHNNHISRIISDHKIQVTNLGECFCETCEVKFSKLYILKHVQNLNHIMLFNMT